MGCKIRVTRDDSGQEFTNEHLAALLRLLPGVTGLLVETDEYVELGDMKIPVVRDADCPPGKVYLVPAPTISGTPPRSEPVTSFDKAVAESVRKAGREFEKLLFASNNQADVNAYVNRQAERMGHTEIHRG